MRKFEKPELYRIPHRYDQRNDGMSKVRSERFAFDGLAHFLPRFQNGGMHRHFDIHVLKKTQRSNYIKNNKFKDTNE